MSPPGIRDVGGLHRHLGAALHLEHAAIPPYLTALYSIPPGTNSEAYHILRAVVVAEMLHLTLAANILNAACRTARRISTGGRFRLHGCDVNP